MSSNLFIYMHDNKHLVLEKSYICIIVIQISLRLEGAEDEVVAIGLDDESATHCLVEGALPPLAEGIAIVEQSLGAQLATTEVEKAYLLTGKGREHTARPLSGLCFSFPYARLEPPIVRNHDGLHAHLTGIAHNERDVSQGVILAEPRSAQVSQTTEALLDAEARGLGQVVVSLFALDMEKSLKPITGPRRDRVAVTHNGINPIRPLNGTVAADHVWSTLQDDLRHAVTGLLSIGEDDGIEISETISGEVEIKLCHALEYCLLNLPLAASTRNSPTQR